MDPPGGLGNIGALIIGIGFGGILYYNYQKEPPKTLFPYITHSSDAYVSILAQVERLSQAGHMLHLHPLLGS